MAEWKRENIEHINGFYGFAWATEYFLPTKSRFVRSFTTNDLNFYPTVLIAAYFNSSNANDIFI